MAHYANEDETFEMWTNRKPSVAYLHEWCIPIQVLIKPRTEPKWKPKTIKGHMVGYISRSNSYRYYIPQKTPLGLHVTWSLNQVLKNQIRKTCEYSFNN